MKLFLIAMGGLFVMFLTMRWIGDALRWLEARYGDKIDEIERR